MVGKQYVPDRGDIIWLDFDLTKGHEQKGSRPAFVVSPKAYNAKADLLLACPIMSQSKGYPFEVACKTSKIQGVVLADHIRSIDWQVRCVRYIATAPASVVQAVEERLLTLIKF